MTETTRPVGRVPKRLRFEILRRDNHTCRHCGASAPDVALQVDHVYPVALGGATVAENLVVACADCNAGKASSTPDTELVAQVSADASRWALAASIAARQKAEERQARLDRRDDRAHAFLFLIDQLDAYDLLPDGWADSVEMLMDRGLTLDDLRDALVSTIRYRRDDPWRYFCKVCWITVGELNELTAEILTENSGPKKDWTPTSNVLSLTGLV